MCLLKQIITHKVLSTFIVYIQSSLNLEEEFKSLKEKRISPLTKRRINHLEKRLEDYKDNEAMYKAQGSNAFTKNFRKTLTRDNKLRANLKRKERLTEELKRLRGEL
ncbi:Uncharacterised protein [Streptococcus agalactiae]|nr:Uncharacterised protein [Streptococcus agalactiae]